MSSWKEAAFKQAILYTLSDLGDLLATLNNPLACLASTLEQHSKVAITHHLCSTCASRPQFQLGQVRKWVWQLLSIKYTQVRKPSRHVWQNSASLPSS